MEVTVLQRSMIVDDLLDFQRDLNESYTRINDRYTLYNSAQLEDDAVDVDIKRVLKNVRIALFNLKKLQRKLG